MTRGDVHTREAHGRWESVVEGCPDLRWVYEGEKDAVRHGAQVADTVGGAHVVERGATSPDVHDVPGHLDGA